MHELYYQPGAVTAGDMGIDHYIVSFVDGDGTRVYAGLQTGKYDEIGEKDNMYIRGDSLGEGDIILSGCYVGYESGTAGNSYFETAYQRYNAEFSGEKLHWTFFL